MDDELPTGVWCTEQIGHLDEHLRWMRRRGMVDSTLVTRRRTLTLIAEHIGHDPADATLDELESWQDSLSGPGVVRHQTMLARPYYTWLQARGHRNDNPALLLATPKRPRRLPKPIAEPDLMRALEDAPDRVRPWLLLAGWCGMRASDIASMHRDRITVDEAGQRWARVIGKNGTERDVPIPGWVWAAVEPSMRPDGWCWRRLRNPGAGIDPPTAQHVSQYCNEYLHAAGLTDTLHSLRARAATRVLLDTANLRTVQVLLGHAGLSTVQDYTLVRPGDLHRAVDRIPRPATAPVPDRPPSGGRPTPNPGISVERAVDEFIAAQRCHNTGRAYRRDMDQFAAWAQRRDLDVLLLDRADVAAFRDWLTVTMHPVNGRRVRYKPATIDRKLGVLGAFYRHLQCERIVHDNPVERVLRPRLARESTTRALSVNDGNALLAAAELAGPVEHAAVALMLIAALRSSEVRNLDVIDVATDSGHRVIDVTRKGGRRQRIAIPDELGDILDAAATSRPATGSKALLVRDGGRLTRHAPAAMVHRLAVHAGISAHVTPHVLRHTAATRAFDAGVSPRDVQELMGHRWQSTTLYYDRAAKRLGNSAALTLGGVFGTPH